MIDSDLTAPEFLEPGGVQRYLCQRGQHSFLKTGTGFGPKDYSCVGCGELMEPNSLQKGGNNMATRYIITETSNGFILETEWDVHNPLDSSKNKDQEVMVFETEGDKYALDKVFKHIQENR